MKTTSLSEFPSTLDTCVRAEESFGVMPLSPSSCGVDDDLAANGHSKVDAKSCGSSRLLVISARRHCIIDPGRFLNDGMPAARRGDRSVVLLQDHLPLMTSPPLQRTSPEA